MDLFQIVSFAGLLIYFAVLLVIVGKDKKSKSVEEYFFAGRQLPFWALSITFIASWWGAGSALSTADLAFEDGLGSFWYYGVPVLISTFLMILFSKSIRRVGYLTQGKMFKSRYSAPASRLLSVLVLVFMTFTAASQMVGVGDFFGSYLGLSYELAILLGTGIVLVYSIIGGFRGVVLTDVVQFVLLLISAIAVFVVSVRNAGGMENLRRVAEVSRDPGYFSLGAGAGKYAAYVITFGCAWMIQANVWQRISATRDDKDAHRMTVMSFFAYIPLYLIVVFTGMAAIGVFTEIPAGGVVTAIVMQYMSPALGALVFVVISAAIMSTMDSVINTGALTLSVDLYSPKEDDDERLKFSRLATFLVAGVALLIAINVRSILRVSWMASDVITTGVFVPLVAGFFWRRGTSKGAVASMAGGFLYCLYNLLIGFGLPLPSFWEPQSAGQVLLGVGLSAVLYVAGSLVSAPEYEKADAFIALARGAGKPAAAAADAEGEKAEKSEETKL